MTKRLSKEELKEIEERCEKATSPPWKKETIKDIANSRGTYFPMTDSNATFIAHARTDIPNLLTEIDALRAESLANSKHIEKLHKELAHQITKYEHDMERGVGAFENEYMKRVAAEKTNETLCDRVSKLEWALVDILDATKTSIGLSSIPSKVREALEGE